MRINILAVILLSFASINVFAAAPVVTGADGVSRIVTEGTVTIYGGFAGDNGVCGFTDLPFSNCCAAILTCTTDPLCACNENRAFNNRVITFAITTDVAGQAIFVEADGTTIIPGLLNTGNSGTSAQITWASLCNAVLESADCEAATTTSGSFRIVMDANRNNIVDSGEEAATVSMRVIKPVNTDYNVFGTVKSEGIGGFTPYPGDEKIYLEDLDTDLNFPNLQYAGSTKVTAVRVYISSAGSNSANPENSIEPATLTVDEDGAELDDSVVDGLENGTRYFFRIALLDEAENVVQFFPSQTDADAQGCNTSPPGAGCQWAATPDQVLGLLTEDFNCFIASAAYGTSIEPKLNILREFRFKVLLQRAWGRSFVKWYYRYGPYAARYIHDKPALRAITQGFLWPVVGFSQLALKIGFVPALTFSLILLSLLLVTPIVAMRRLKARA